MRNISFILLAFLALGCTSKVTSVTSPDGRIAVNFQLEEGVPYYSVDVEGTPLLAASRMGLEASEADLSGGFSLVRSKVSSYEGTWHQPWGENKEVTDRHKSLIVSLKNPSGVALDVEFRVFDDGVGFRYYYAVEGADTLRISGERTEFRFADDAVSWSIPGDFNSYEHLYRKMPLSALSDANTPLTMRFSDCLYASVHEAAIVDFPEMVLRKTEGTAFQAALAPLHGSSPDLVAVVPGIFQTPGAPCR